MISSKKPNLTFINRIFFLAHTYKTKRTRQFKDKILINAFFEPSTRTSLSFESAMYRLGGNVINFNKDLSSIKKGESFEDTIRTISTYGDAIIIRHPEKGIVEKAAKISTIPVINGGDGDGEHPTQGLLDLFTIHKCFNLQSRINILFVGDIMHSRTVNSLLDYLSIYPFSKINILPYNNREPNYDLLYEIAKDHTQIVDDIVVSEDTVELDKYDVVYVTRLQKERSSKNDRVTHIVDNNFLSKTKKNCIIMHPLPRNEEINPEIDNDPRCKYFEQMENGVAIRMALLHYMFVDEKNRRKIEEESQFRRKYEEILKNEIKVRTKNMINGTKT
jgi:carbamoyl-phosphate synthase/aspartate carbamoyltransferase